MHNNFQFWPLDCARGRLLTSDFWPLVAFLSQTTNNPCAHYILPISAKFFFDLPLPPFFKGPTFVALPRRNGSAVNWYVWIDSICQAQRPKTLHFAPLILTFQAGQFVCFAQDFALRKAKIHKLHPSYFIPNEQLSRQGKFRAIHSFFNAIKQNLKLEQNNTKKCQKALKNAHFWNHRLLHLCFCNLSTYVNFHKKSA